MITISDELIFKKYNTGFLIGTIYLKLNCVEYKQYSIWFYCNWKQEYLNVMQTFS